MNSLEAHIHRENLILFKKRIADPHITDAQRRQVLRLLAEEETKDFYESACGPVDKVFTHRS